MQPYKITLVIIAAIIVTTGVFGAGWWTRTKTYRTPECPKCPDIVARAHVERDSIGQRPPVAVLPVKKAPAIKTSFVQIFPSERDVAVYEWRDTMPDGATLGVHVQSSEFPRLIPADFERHIWYIGAPERIRVVNDTLTVQLPPLACPKKSFVKTGIKIGGVCFAFGIATTAGTIIYLKAKGVL
jgi:hypothetical protein